MTLVRLISREGDQGHRTLCRPGQCPACDVGWKKLRADAREGDNLKDAWELRNRVKRHVSGHPGCTLSDLYRDLGCSDIPLYICLHLLVQDFELSGPNPYACGAPNEHEACTYRMLHLPGPPSE
jgi:hypothetical protein